ncbi:MAG TPA: FtsX-like permease family protein, partial [Ktedonobacterales bacterium]|nr:FtsX-like permease family protein [Ktedonobacterales bacterium]
IPLAIQSYPDLAHVPLHPFQLTQGRYPNTGEILMDFNDQQVHSFHIGDTVTVKASQGTAQLRVVGITSTAGFSPQNGGGAIGYVSTAGLQQIAGTTTGIAIEPNKRPPIPSLENTVNVKAQQAGANQLSATQAAVTQALTAHQVNVFTAFRPNANTNLALIEKTIGGLFWLLRILIILAVVMSGFLILGTVTTLIAEQTTIIGIMKAMGGTRGQIMRGYLLTVTITCAPATIIGVALGLDAGYSLASTLAQQVPMPLLPFAADPLVIVIGLAIGFGIPLLAALIPIWNGLRITVRDALAAYGVQAGAEASWLARLGQRLTWVSQTTWLGVRGTFRKRWRAALTLATLSVAGICFLVVQIAVTSVNGTVADSTATSSADLTVRFGDPTTYSHISAQLAALPNVKHIEPYASGN